MKGFIYLIEIIVAAVLIVVAISTFASAQNVKLDWSRPDLVATGNNIIQVLASNAMLNRTLFDESVLDAAVTLKQPNINIGIDVAGVPGIVDVGCSEDCNYVASLLTDSVVNGRRVAYRVVDIDPATENFKSFDVVVFRNFVDFDADMKIQNYLAAGGKVVSINSISGGQFSQMDSTFGLTAGAGAPATLSLVAVAPPQSRVPKYFSGLSFNVSTPFRDVNGLYHGTWRVWENDVDIASDVSRIIVQGFPPGTYFNEGESFPLTGPDGGIHMFKVRRVLWPTSVIIEPQDAAFPFKSFTADSVKADATAVNLVADSGSNIAAMVQKGNAVWISDFPASDEYALLVKSAIASLQDRWTLYPARVIRGKAEVSTFIGQCCDTAEIAKLIFILSYAY